MIQVGGDSIGMDQALEIIRKFSKTMDSVEFENLLFHLGSLVVKKISVEIFMKKTDESSREMAILSSLISGDPYSVNILPDLAEYTIDRHNHCDYIAKMFISLLKLKMKDVHEVLHILKDYRLEKCQVESIYQLIHHDIDLIEAFKAFVHSDLVYLLNH